MDKNTEQLEPKVLLPRPINATHTNDLNEIDKLPFPMNRICKKIVRSYRGRNVFDEENSDWEPEDTYFAW